MDQTSVTVLSVDTFDVTIEPASPRMVAMLFDAFRAEDVTVVSVPRAAIEESRSETLALTFAAATFVLQAVDSKAVHRAIDKVNERFSGRLKARVTPRHKR
jgi:hypothetical protein